MKTNQHILTTILIILLLLWIPVSLDKLLNFGTFKTGILRQPFPDALGQVLIYSLPLLEIGTVVLLIGKRFKWAGFGLSSLLMIAFTAYIGVALLGAWDKLPCGCGSVISGMSWKQHFWFNLFFLVVSVMGWAMAYKNRKDAMQVLQIVETQNPRGFIEDKSCVSTEQKDKT